MSTFLNTILFDNENDNSIITLINESGLRFLLMGDAGKDAENAIEEVIEPFMKEHPSFKWR